MINIQDLITSSLGSAAKDAFAKQLGVDPAKAESLLGTLTPLITGALAKNTATKEGAQSLATALDKDHDGSVLTDLAGMLEQGGTSDAGKIINHIFGAKKEKIEAGVATATGESQQTIDKALTLLGPIVMGALGKAKKEQGFGVDDIAGLLSSSAKNSGGDSLTSKLITSLLDKDNDGSVMDDMLDMGMKTLGNMFKK